MDKIKRITSLTGDSTVTDKNGEYVYYSDHKKHIKALKKQLRIQHVSNRKELLTAFCEFLKKDLIAFTEESEYELYIDVFESNLSFANMVTK